MKLSLEQSETMGNGPYTNLHKHIELRTSPVHGLGLFAISPIPKNTKVWINRENGPMHNHYKTYTFDELKELPNDVRSFIVKYGTQLTENTINGPQSEADLTADNSNYFNHSCNPNCLPINENEWIAINDINPTDELTVDYVTFDCNEYSNIPTCLCGSKLCRGELSADDYQLPDLQKRYIGHFVPFIQNKINDKINH